MTRTYTATSSEVLRNVSTILLENPAAIEHLPHAEAKSLERVLEANGLEASLLELARNHGVEGLINPARLSAWRLSKLMSEARSQAFREALKDVAKAARGLGIPLRLFRGTQMAFEVYPAPEHRPLTSLELLVGGGREAELQTALRKCRFFELDSLTPIPPGHHHLPPLDRDGVLVTLFRRSSRDARPAPWEASPHEKISGSIPGFKSAELMVLLCDEIAERKYSHSLRLLRDLHEAATRLSPDWQQVVQLAIASERTLEVFAALSILEDLLGTPVPAEALLELKALVSLGKPGTKLLLKVARATSLSTPAPHRHIEILTRLLCQSSRETSALMKHSS